MSSKVRLRRYLARATRGLWGRRRALVRSELEGHVRVRSSDLRLAGLSEEEALSQALDELGAPALVSRGMACLYTLPRVTPLLLAGLLLAPTVSLSQGPVADVEVLRVGLMPRCDSRTLTLQIVEVPGGLSLLTERCVVDMGQSWLGLDGLRAVVQTAGGSWREQPGELELRFPGGTLVKLVLPIDAPGTDRDGVVSGASASTGTVGPPADAAEGTGEPVGGVAVFDPVAIQHGGERYLSTAAFVQALAEQSGLVVRLEPNEGGSAPRLHVGDTNLELAGLPQEAVRGVFARALTHRLLEERAIERVAWDLERDFRAPEQYLYSLTAPANSEDALYAVAYRVTPGTVRLSLVSPDASGTLRVRLPWAEPAWVNDAAELEQERSALLVRLTGILSDLTQLYEPLTPSGTHGASLAPWLSVRE